MFSCIAASASGKNLLSSGMTTCRYQSSTSVTSNVGTADAFIGRYMSASSDRVQLRRNWVKTVLLISDTSLWEKTTHFGLCRSKSSGYNVRDDACERSYFTCQGHKFMNEACDGFKSCHESTYNLLKDRNKYNQIRTFPISAWVWQFFQFLKSQN